MTGGTSSPSFCLAVLPSSSELDRRETVLPYSDRSAFTMRDRDDPPEDVLELGEDEVLADEQALAASEADGIEGTTSVAAWLHSSPAPMVLRNSSTRTSPWQRWLALQWQMSILP
eukprot:4239919-Lingulodinium_polyedra.AAC.1